MAQRVLPLPNGKRHVNEHNNAIDIAIAEIQAGFSRAAEIKSFKRCVAHWLRLGPQHPSTRARFRARAAALPDWRLDAAIREVERWWREERKTFALASALGLRVASAARDVTRAAAHSAAAAKETVGNAVRGDRGGGMRAGDCDGGGVTGSFSTTARPRAGRYHFD
jgi:hypothetical protein